MYAMEILLDHGDTNNIMSDSLSLVIYSNTRRTQWGLVHFDQKCLVPSKLDREERKQRSIEM